MQAIKIQDLATYRITIQDLATYRLGRNAITGGDFERAGLPIMGGCEICHATIAAYNACPSTSGYLRCAADCIGDDGYESVFAANGAIFGGGLAAGHPAFNPSTPSANPDEWDDDPARDCAGCGEPLARHDDVTNACPDA